MTYKISNDKLGYYTLEIPLAGEKDEGPYEIIAENEHGIMNHTFYLQQADPPIFIEPFKDVTVHNHEDVTIMCKVDGIPYPEVKFYKDWRLLTESYRIKIKHIEPDAWIITIKGSIIRDTGLYTCTAKNLAGGTLCSCNVNVIDSLLNIPRPDLSTPFVPFKRKKIEEDYEIVEEVTRSPNAAVFKVIEKRSAKEYVAKIAYKPEYTSWIKSEADCLNNVHQASNSNVVKLHDAYETPNDMFILIFEEIQGDDLIKTVLKDENTQKLDERQVSQYIKQLLEILNDLHSRNIVHLDINPDNIILDNKTGKLNLLGFTHSKHLKPNVLVNNYHENVYHDYGNPEFIAPEIVQQKPVTLNTDMWSVGALSYILLSGKSPFYSPNIKEILYNIANNIWNFGDEFLNISHEARDFITRLFNTDPKERMNVEQALNHPWMHYSSHKVPIADINKKNLVQFYSRQLWNNQAKQVEPWTKLKSVSSILEEPTDNLFIPTEELNEAYKELFNRNRREKSYSIDDTNNRLVGRRYSVDENENLNPGTYLLPIRDPLFTVRLREYRRTRFEKNPVLSNLSNPVVYGRRNEVVTQTRTNEKRKIIYKPVKERYHIDGYGKCLRGGSITKQYTLERELSVRSSPRFSESPLEGTVHYFEQFLDHIDDKRQIFGEGLAPIVREKLKDSYILVGSSISLRCKIEGNPTPKTVWYFNNRLIIGDDDRLKFAQTEDGIITLSITKARV